MPELLHSLFSSVWSVLLVIVFFGGSIFVHELGHFLAARWRGLHVERFSIGFGRLIFSRRGKDGVVYGLAWLPLGGYVLLPQLADLGMVEGKSEADPARLPPISYRSKMIVFVAGAAFNILFAFALACVLWAAGQPQSSELASTRIGYIGNGTREAADAPVPARAAGLRVGDLIEAVDGHAVKDWGDLQQSLVASTGREPDGRPRAVLTIERGGQVSEIVVHPRIAGDNHVRQIGILPDYELDVAGVAAGSVAAQAGFAAGDVLLQVDAVPARNDVLLAEYLQSRWNRPLAVSVRRAGRELTLALPPRASEKAGADLADLGIELEPAQGTVHVSPFVQIGDQVTSTLRVLVSLLNPRSDVGLASVGTGPVGIVRYFHSAAQSGLTPVLMLTVVVNVSLAIFNLLPIPVLDGGQMLFATIGRIRGRPLSLNVVGSMQLASLALVASLFLYLSYFDVKHWVKDARDERAAATAKP